MRMNFWELSQFNLAGVNCLYTALIKLKCCGCRPKHQQLGKLFWARHKARPKDKNLFCRLVFLFFNDFCAGFLINHFHRQANFAAIIKAEQFDFDTLPFFENI